MGIAKIEVPEDVRQRYQDGKRAEVRLAAAADAAALLREKTSWTPDDVRTLLGLLQQDWYGGKIVRNRFSPGLVGQHVAWLLETLEPLGRWLSAVREVASAPIDDDVAKQLLTMYWDAEIKNSFVFPTAVLAALEPNRFIVSTKPTKLAMNELDPGGDYRRKKDPAEYMRLCQAVRDLCEREGWQLCLTDAALRLSKTEGPVGPLPSPAGYSKESVAFLRSLADHTQDPAWHRQNRERYQSLLRDPTLALFKDIGTRFIAALDQDVAESNRPTSILKKNDFGGDTYYAHYWFAFFDPAAKKKTESVQLFARYAAETPELVRYGLGVGHYGRTYHDNLLTAMAKAPQAAAMHVAALPPDTQVRLVYKDESERVHRIEKLADALRRDALESLLEDSSKLRSLMIEKQVDTLDYLAERGLKLSDDMGSLFVALWPLFEAARSGSFEAVAPRPVGGDQNGSSIDEGAPETLQDLALVTSLSEKFLGEMEDALLAKGQVILVGPPGTSKTFVAKWFARYFARYQPGIRPQGEHRVIYMHASWAYEDFFEGVRPKLGVTGLEFDHHRGAFLRWVEETVKKGPPGARYVLVLDEINRCDTAAVLGELLQLMEYRGQPVDLLSGKTFLLPKKLYIIGTMNSADRSIGRMDLALRRRFLFLDLLPDPDVLEAWLGAGRNRCKFDAAALRECNDWLEKTHGIGREQQVGHALFMPSAAHGDGDEDDGDLTADMLRRVVRYSVKPYVRELLLERGRDPGPALQHVESFFSAYWGEDPDEDE